MRLFVTFLGNKHFIHQEIFLFDVELSIFWLMVRRSAGTVAFLGFPKMELESAKQKFFELVNNVDASKLNEFFSWIKESFAFGNRLGRLENSFPDVDYFQINRTRAPRAMLPCTKLSTIWEWWSQKIRFFHPKGVCFRNMAWWAWIPIWLYPRRRLSRFLEFWFSDQRESWNYQP